MEAPGAREAPGSRIWSAAFWKLARSRAFSGQTADPTHFRRLHRLHGILLECPESAGFLEPLWRRREHIPGATPAVSPMPLFLMRCRAGASGHVIRLNGRLNRRLRRPRRGTSFDAPIRQSTLRLGWPSRIGYRRRWKEASESRVSCSYELLRDARQRVRDLRHRATDKNELPDRLTKCGEELSQNRSATVRLAISENPGFSSPRCRRKPVESSEKR